MDKLKSFFMKHGFTVGVASAIFFLLIFLYNYSNYSKYSSRLNLLYEQEIEITKNLKSLNTYMGVTEMIYRGYLLNQNGDGLSDIQVIAGKYSKRFRSVKQRLLAVDYDISRINKLEIQFDEYINLIQKGIDWVEMGDMNSAMKVVSEKHESLLYQEYRSVAESVDEHIAAINLDYKTSYEFYKKYLLYSIVLIFVFSIPVAIGLVQRYYKLMRNEKSMIANLKVANDTYIFKDNNHADRNKDEIINVLMSNLKKAANFVQNIAEGNYEVKWEGYSDANQTENDENLSGELIKLRNKLNNIKSNEAIRNWTAEGISKFNALIRRYQDSPQQLTDMVLMELVKFMDARQGAIYLPDVEKTNKNLEMISTYAYDRKKYMQKNIAVGDGLVGQCFLEQKPSRINKLPEGYTHINSGLGDVNPSSLLLIPFVSNEKAEGVLELASLVEYEDYQVEFLMQVGEIIASFVNTSKINSQTSTLLAKTKKQAEEMQAQEEELRQNMEEMMATQEQSERRIKELLGEIDQLKN